ncbi:MAG: AAA family ATPase [Nitrospirae bacterium]|nr:AAA family ATPase [Nitrospirota bacterium]
MKEEPILHEILFENLGPIKYLQIEVKDYLVLIGQQATGKSTISKLVYFFRTIKDEMYRHFSEAMKKLPDYNESVITDLHNDFIKRITRKFHDIYGHTYLTGDMTIQYSYSNQTYRNNSIYTEDIDIAITLETTTNKNTMPNLDIQMSHPLEYAYFQLYDKTILNKKKIRLIDEKLTNSLSDVDIAMLNEEKERYFKELKNELNKLFNDDTTVIYIPAGRTMATVFADLMDKEDIKRKDLLTGNFIERIKRFRFFHSQVMKENIEGTPSHTKAIDMMKEILKADYVYENDEDRLYIGKDKYVEIQFASSGQQESLWILLTLYKILLDEQKVLFIVEEPEAHLYPIAQRKLVEFISFVMKATNSQMIITTHSPYILTSLNNLIFANNIAKKTGKESEVSEIVDKRKWIDIDKMGVFELKDGGYVDIIDRKLNFIKAEAIDKASDDIEDDYEKLLDVK